MYKTFYKSQPYELRFCCDIKKNNFNTICDSCTMLWESAAENYSDSADFFFRFTVLVVLSAQIKKKKNENGNC